MGQVYSLVGEVRTILFEENENGFGRPFQDLDKKTLFTTVDQELGKHVQGEPVAIHVYRQGIINMEEQTVLLSEEESKEVFRGVFIGHERG